MAAVQLDMFGDLLDSPSEEIVIPKDQIQDHNQEASNEPNRVAADGESALGKILPNDVQAIPGTGDIASKASGSSNQYETGIGQSNGERNEALRSGGDSVSQVHISTTGGGTNQLDTRPAGTLRNGHTDDKNNYHISFEDSIGDGGKVTKFEANLAAITLLKKLEEQKRYATPQEQSVLVKYVGWGGISEPFALDAKGTWKDRQDALKELLTTEEFNAARKSTMTAHYTSPIVAKSVWDAARRMGYNGGPTLEPAVGTGMFFGLRPDDLHVEMEGIELDPTSGRIAQQLYQQANIRICGYQDFKIPENHYNLAISNVPFGDFKLFEPVASRTPGLENKYLIHDAYFLKTLHGVKENGVVAFITSRGTLDKSNPEVREKIAEKADFIGAIRLPSTAFKQITDTEVIADIVFLQKRSPEKEMSEQTRNFINAHAVEMPNVKGEGSSTIHMNSYFIDNPQMVLGNQDLSGTMYGGNGYNVCLAQDATDSDFEELLNKAIHSLPADIMHGIVDKKSSELQNNLNEYFKTLPDYNKKPVLSFVIGPDGVLCQKLADGEYHKSALYEELETSTNSREKNRLTKDISIIKELVLIRDSLQKTLAYSANGQNIDAAVELENLNKLYDSFVSQYGYINKTQNISAFNDDPSYPLLMAAEHWDAKNKTATKADLLKGVTIASRPPVTSVDTPEDALILSLNEYGRVDLPFMANVTNMTEEAIRDDLLLKQAIYQDPRPFLATHSEVFLTADAYICGNVREKLRSAEEAALHNPSRFANNIESLKAAIPIDLQPHEISLKINSPVVGEKYVQQFVRELLNSENTTVDHLSINGKWNIESGWDINRTRNRETYGTSRINAIELIELTLNGKAIQVFDKGDDGERIYNQAESLKAEMQVEKIKQEFQRWIWSDPDRTDTLVRKYNDEYNSTVNRKFIHPLRIKNTEAEIHFHGCSFPYPARKHQADAVWRLVQNDSNMLAHTVGAGKTMEMTWAAMEQKRLGIRNKPMIVIPNHMLAQWSNDIIRSYPNAKILIANENEFSKENRQIFANKIATGNWDCIVIRMSSFEMLPLSAEYQERFIESKLEEYRKHKEELRASKGNSFSVQEIEKSIQKYETKLKELAEIPRDDGVIEFDKLGIDQIYVDEADIFKNLEFYTQLENVKGLGEQKGSDRSFDMLMKVRHIQEIGGGVTFATGTPISNTLVEAYTMQRFLQPESLKARGLEAFDEWAREYAETVTQLELNNTGTGYKAATRFSKIVNIPELITDLSEVWDIQTAEMLKNSKILIPGENIPKADIQNLAAPSTQELKSYLRYLENRESNLKASDKNSDNVLNIITDGKKASIDLRMINQNIPEIEDSKLNLGVKTIADLYKKYEKQRYTTLIFFDKPNSNSGFKSTDEMKAKLIAQGVRPEEIGDIRDCKTQAQKQALFDAVNKGDIRIIFGSTVSMGAGTNIQKRLKAIIHMDVPWRPRDIEQRNGRGLRPGNTVKDFDEQGNCITPEGKCGTVHLYNMVTKGSLDTGAWNVLETKSTTINQIMSGQDRSTREIEETYYGSAKELSIDDPLMKESVELSHDLKRLHSMQRSFNDQLSQANRAIIRGPQEIERLEEKIELIKQDLAQREAKQTGKDWRMVIGDTEYDNKAKAGEVLKSRGQKIHADLYQRDMSKSGQIEVGRYAGLPLCISATCWGNNKTLDAQLSVQGNFTYSVNLKSDSSPIGLITSLDNRIYSEMENFLAQTQKDLNSIKVGLIDSEKIANSSFPFEKTIQEKELRQKEVMELLSNQTEKQQESIKYDIPWDKLDYMTPAQVEDEFRKFREINFEPTRTEAPSQPQQPQSSAAPQTTAEEPHNAASDAVSQPQQPQSSPAPQTAAEEPHRAASEAPSQPQQPQASPAPQTAAGEPHNAASDAALQPQHPQSSAAPQTAAEEPHRAASDAVSQPQQPQTSPAPQPAAGEPHRAASDAALQPQQPQSNPAPQTAAGEPHRAASDAVLQPQQPQTSPGPQTTTGEPHTTRSKELDDAIRYIENSGLKSNPAVEAQLRKDFETKSKEEVYARIDRSISNFQAKQNLSVKEVSNTNYPTSMQEFLSQAKQKGVDFSPEVVTKMQSQIDSGKSDFAHLSNMVQSIAAKKQASTSINPDMGI
jgi:N12 class adenine-specific DNA methylase